MVTEGERMLEIYTIGYSPYTVGAFVETLQKFQINCLIDVRSNPHSAYYTDYDKETLSERLKKAGILYRNYAREFGARQEDLRFYCEEGYLDFDVFVKSEQFNDGVDKIKKGIELGYRFVLMCAEKDPMTCHRAIMIGKSLKENGFLVKHIIFPEQVETQEEMEHRAIGNQLSFFSEEDRIKEFYQNQNRKIGYHLDDTKEGIA